VLEIYLDLDCIFLDFETVKFNYWPEISGNSTTCRELSTFFYILLIRLFLAYLGSFGLWEVKGEKGRMG
jgi:hypothetical protein